MGTHDGAGDETGQEEAGFAFNEFDKNKDKKVAWEEWEALMSSPTLESSSGQILCQPPTDTTSGR